MKDHSLWLIEDNCDALGSALADKFTGTWGHVATQSFYPAHHITVGEGGMVMTDNPHIHKAVESFRDWGRDCWCEPGKENTCGKRFDYDWDHLPHGYDHKYVYSHLGFNFKSTDIQAAIGLAQLERLITFTRARYDNVKRLWLRMREVGLHDFFILPEPSDETAKPNWFGFPLTIRTFEGSDSPLFNREDLMRFLSDKKIGTRLLFAGNYMKQPVFHDVVNSGMLEAYRIVGDLPATDRIVRDTFWVGCWPGITDEMIEYVISQILEFIKKKGVA
jgi:CDP-6-deoxy-D-xylo-4-hexulose-3-dehydrase